MKAKKNGLPLLDALKALASPAILKAMEELKGGEYSPIVIDIYDAGAATTLHDHWVAATKPAADQLIARLRSGDLRADGFRMPVDPVKGREPIAASTWDVAGIEWGASKIWLGSNQVEEIMVSGLGGSGDSPVPALNKSAIIRFAVDLVHPQRIVFENGVELKGSECAMFLALLPGGSPMSMNIQAVAVETLQKRLRISEEATVRSTISRIGKSFGARTDATENSQGKNAIVLNVKRGHYQLSDRLALVPLSTIENA